MACFHPITAYRAPPGYQARGANFGGITFDDRLADIPGVEELKLPCGRCVGCRLEKSRQWAMRIVLEQQIYDESCFITLTYNDDHLPGNGSLKQEDVTLFLKRLRKYLDKEYGKKVRYFYCGEYGSKFARPHYHICLFGFDFSKTRKFYKFTPNGDCLYIDENLEKIWSKGYCPIGSLTFDSAAYTARYILKKLNGDIADEHYKGRKPEFICMSRMPGIGSEWLKKYSSDIYSKDYIHLRNGIKARPPKYFDRLFASMHEPSHLIDDVVVPDDEYKRFLELKKKRKEYAENDLENSPDRLKQREMFIKLTLKQKRRNYEECG